jgi:hypothetical protein
MQGGIHPDLPGTAYLDLAREVKRRQPGIHLHAFSPMEIVNGAARTGLSFEEFLLAAQEAGPRLRPRDGGGDPRRRRPLGAHQGQAARRDLAGDRHAPRTGWASRRRRR